jgi:hypothetical protein
VHADAAAIYALNPEAGVLDLVDHYNLRDPHHNIFEAYCDSKTLIGGFTL